LKLSSVRLEGGGLV